MEARHQMGAVKRIHFVGIGGIGMSGIAMILAQRGFHVTGSDLSLEGEIIQRLQAQGILIHLGHDASQVIDKDVLVVSSAIPLHNVERQAAIEAGIPILKRAEMLAELMRFQHGIAISGTHGKTTTTSMVATLFEQAALDPTVVVGGQIKCSKSQMRIGDSRYFVAEADESDASFLHLRPLLSVITSLDLDHMETYDASIEALKQAFVKFVHQLPFYGVAVLNIDDERLRQLKPQLNRTAITYGTHAQAQFQVQKIEQDGLRMRFNLKDPDGNIHAFVLSCPGHHNVSNAAAAIITARQCGVAWPKIQAAIANFKGVQRRFDVLGQFAINENKTGIIVVDDYGHHPKATEVTLSAARTAWPNRRIILCFEPHRYSRLNALFDDFAEQLTAADAVLLMPTYACGEAPIAGRDSAHLREAILARFPNQSVQLIEDFSVLGSCLQQHLRCQDVLIAQGAGRISKALRALVSQWRVELTEVPLD